MTNLFKFGVGMVAAIVAGSLVNGLLSPAEPRPCSRCDRALDPEISHDSHAGVCCHCAGCTR